MLKALLSSALAFILVLGSSFSLATTYKSSTVSDIGARVTNSTATTISDNTFTAVPLDTETFDTGNLHSTSVNTDRFTITVAGKYLIIATAGFVNNATGMRTLNVRLNGSNNIIFNQDSSATVSTFNHLASSSTIIDLVASDFVSFEVFQTSGGNLDLNAFGDFAPVFAIMLLQ